MTEDPINELNKNKEIEKTVNRENLVYRKNEYTYIFKFFLTIKAFGKDIYSVRITLKEADEDQSSL